MDNNMRLRILHEAHVDSNKFWAYINKVEQNPDASNVKFIFTTAKEQGWDSDVIPVVSYKIWPKLSKPDQAEVKEFINSLYGSDDNYLWRFIEAGWAKGMSGPYKWEDKYTLGKIISDYLGGGHNIGGATIQKIVENNRQLLDDEQLLAIKDKVEQDMQDSAGEENAGTYIAGQMKQMLGIPDKAKIWGIRKARQDKTIKDLRNTLYGTLEIISQATMWDDKDPEFVKILSDINNMDLESARNAVMDFIRDIF